MENKLSRISLEELRKGQLIRAVGEDELGKSFFDFLVVEPGREPLCLATVQNPHGTYGPNSVVLRGTGIWTTHQQNPAQTFFPEKQLTIDYGGINRGGNLVVIDADSPDRKMFNFVPPVKEIEIYPA